MRVLVCGATGYLGGFVCSELHHRGHSVCALSRKPEDELPEELRRNVDRVVVAKATRRDDLVGLCKGIDVVFSCLGNHTLKRSPSVWEVDEQANINILDAALEAESSVSLFIFVSVLFGDKLRKLFDQGEARERVVDALRVRCQESAERFRFVVIRPSGFFNDMKDLLYQSKGTTIWTIGSGKNILNPIHGEDLASYCVDKLEANAKDSQVEHYYNVGGPEFLTMREIHRLASKAWHKEPKRLKFISVPSWLVRVLARLVKLFNGNLASVINMFSVMSTVSTEEMMTVDSYGSHKIEGFFIEEVAKDHAA
mmetsp:Transcript_35985/g.44677  ORF Transcript_35985/g.44677 Transcript_35985/m.44677 type:complete len:310 (+) Transcript_35985:75-1004(+)